MPFQVYGTEIQFPYEPYPVQFVLMEKILRACENSQNALLESPTGTGKSLALLCAVLAWQNKVKNKLQQEKVEKENLGKERFASAVAKCRKKDNTAVPLRTIYRDNPIGSDEETQSLSSNEDFQDQQPPKLKQMTDNEFHNYEDSLDSSSHGDNLEMIVPKIFFATRTHAQIHQVVQELRRTSYRPKMDILGSRNQYCIHNKVTKSQNRNEECKKLLEERSCSYAFGVEKIHSVKELSKVCCFYLGFPQVSIS